MPEKNHGAVPLGEESTILGQLKDMHQPDIYRDMNSPRSDYYPPFVRGNLAEAGPAKPLRFFDPKRIEESSLDLAAKAFKENPQNPETIRAVWQQVWSEWGNRIKKKFEVPKVDYSTLELSEMEASDRMLVYLPPEIKKEENRFDLFLMFPDMQGVSPESFDDVKYLDLIGSDARNIYRKGGYFDVEKSLLSPHHSLSEEEIRHMINGNPFVGQDIVTYIIASNFSQLLTGHKFDETSRSRLLGSQLGDSAVTANFVKNNGTLIIDKTHPMDKVYNLGARTMGSNQFKFKATKQG